MAKDVIFGGIKIDTYTIDEFVEIIENNIKTREKLIQQTGINAHNFISSKSDPVLYKAMNNSTLVNIDGMSIVWALKLLGYKNITRASCPDIFNTLISRAEDKQYRLFFLGATSSVIEKAIQNLNLKYPRLLIAGYHHGFFTDENSDEIADMIKDSMADLLFLGMPSPKKELFSEKYKHRMQVSYTLGVGGVFDILANKTKRAPLWMQKTGIEWLYRLVQEPRRLWHRYLIDNTKFIWTVAKAKLKKLTRYDGLSHYVRSEIQT